MSKRNRPTEPEPETATATVLDPPESGPPTAEELGQAEPKLKEDVDHGSKSAERDTGIGEEVGQAEPTASAAPEEKVAESRPAAPDCSTIVANLDRQSAPAWPTSSPFKVDWPWSGEPDPVPGDIVGWNWEQREIAVVTAVPPATAPWPYTLTVEVRPMPEEWLMNPVKVFNLNTGERLDVEWYTRWNRAYSQFVLSDEGGPVADESGKDVKRVVGSGWLAVVQEKAGQ